MKYQNKNEKRFTPYVTRSGRVSRPVQTFDPTGQDKQNQVQENNETNFVPLNFGLFNTTTSLPWTEFTNVQFFKPFAFTVVTFTKFEEPSKSSFDQHTDKPIYENMKCCTNDCSCDPCNCDPCCCNSKNQNMMCCTTDCTCDPCNCDPCCCNSKNQNMMRCTCDPSTCNFSNDSTNEKMKNTGFNMYPFENTQNDSIFEDMQNLDKFEFKEKDLKVMKDPMNTTTDSLANSEFKNAMNRFVNMESDTSADVSSSPCSGNESYFSSSSNSSEWSCSCTHHSSSSSSSSIC